MEIHYFTKKEMVSFGNYLLSKERKESFENHPELGSENLEERLSQVHDSDVANWFAKQEIKLAD